MNDTNDINEINGINEEQNDPHELAEKNFYAELKQVGTLYLYTVIISALIVACGLICAIIYKVFIGLLIGILGVLFYTVLTSNILYKRLGISYRSTSGALTVTQLYGQDRSEIWIPERLLWITVTEIGDKAFDHASSSQINTVHLPATLKAVGKDIFAGCTELRTVCFDGSREQWKQIESLTDFSPYEIIFKDCAAPTENGEADSITEVEGI